MSSMFRLYIIIRCCCFKNYLIAAICERPRIRGPASSPIFWLNWKCVVVLYSVFCIYAFLGGLYLYLCIRVCVSNSNLFLPKNNEGTRCERQVLSLSFLSYALSLLFIYLCAVFFYFILLCLFLVIVLVYSILFLYADQ